MVEYHSCKLGTVPAEVQLFRAYRVRPGIRLKFRKKGDHKWRFGWVYDVLEDGYFKMVLTREIAIELIEETANNTPTPKNDKNKPTK